MTGGSSLKKDYLILVLVANENIKNIEEREHHPYYSYNGNMYTIYQYNSGSYYEKIDKNRDGWIKSNAHDKMVGDHYKCENIFSDSSYEEIPGGPTIYYSDFNYVGFVIDVDKDEEYALGILNNENDAYEWSDNMIKYFKARD